MVLVDFWGIICGPCVAELPEVRKAEERFAGTYLVAVGLQVSGGTAGDGAGFAVNSGADVPSGRRPARGVGRVRGGLRRVRGPNDPRRGGHRPPGAGRVRRPVPGGAGEGGGVAQGLRRSGGLTRGPGRDRRGQTARLSSASRPRRPGSRRPPWPPRPEGTACGWSRRGPGGRRARTGRPGGTVCKAGRTSAHTSRRRRS